MTTASWTAPANTVMATTALNSLPASTYSGVLTEFNNSSGTYQYGDLELLLGADLTALTGVPRVDVFLIPCLDGTNYPNPPSGTGAVPGNYFVGSIFGVSAATFRRGMLMGIVLPPCRFKLDIYHALHGSTAFNSSGNVLTLYTYNDQGT